jgi:hypothetical protein
VARVLRVARVLGVLRVARVLGVLRVARVARVLRVARALRCSGSRLSRFKYLPIGKHTSDATTAQTVSGVRHA